MYVCWPTVVQRQTATAVRLYIAVSHNLSVGFITAEPRLRVAQCYQALNIHSAVIAQPVVCN